MAQVAPASALHSSPPVGLAAKVDADAGQVSYAAKPRSGEPVRGDVRQFSGVFYAQQGRLTGADLTGALASGARFGKDPVTKKWAEMEGAILEDTLLSQSDTRELCKNPTLDYDTMAILGC